MLRVQKFYSRLLAAPVERERNPRPAHGECPQLAFLFEGDGRCACGDRRRDFCRIPQRVCEELRAVRESVAGARGGAAGVRFYGSAVPAGRFKVAASEKRATKKLTGKMSGSQRWAILPP